MTTPSNTPPNTTEATEGMFDFLLGVTQATGTAVEQDLEESGTILDVAKYYAANPQHFFTDVLGNTAFRGSKKPTNSFLEPFFRVPGAYALIADLVSQLPPDILVLVKQRPYATTFFAHLQQGNKRSADRSADEVSGSENKKSRAVNYSL